MQQPAGDQLAGSGSGRGGKGGKSGGGSSQHRRLMIFNGILYVIALVGLVVSIVLAGVNLRGQLTAAKQISLTKDLAQELRQSSDDLTRFIRTYTVTDNATYWDFFNRVIRIRNGNEGLPSEPHRNYWDLFIPSGIHPRPIGEPDAFDDRVAKAGFTDEEVALLEEAKANSDTLIDLENIAYNALQGNFRPNNTDGLSVEQAKEFSVSGPKNPELARQLVHSVEYHQEKGKIMKPIDEFATKSTARILADLDRLEVQGIIILVVLGCMLAILIVLVLIYIFKIARDSQTQEILRTMLPARVAASLTVAHFNSLRDMAKQHSHSRREKSDRSRRRRKSANERSAVPPAGLAMDNNDDAVSVEDDSDTHSSVSSASSLFPVLYSEFIPIGWISFTDVVGFTNMCRLTDSETVIAVLNEMFSLMDVEAANFGVEKIKTIGDAFMCAKLPRVANRTDKDGIEIIQFLMRVIDLATTVRKPMHARENPEDKHLKIRVGLNVGPMSAGIVGFERPLYDLFGDTVNTGARLESSGVPNFIHIPESAIPYFGRYVSSLVYSSDPAHLDPGEKTRSVDLKGIGRVRTRLVAECTYKTLSRSHASNLGTLLNNRNTTASGTFSLHSNSNSSVPAVVASSPPGGQHIDDDEGEGDDGIQSFHLSAMMGLDGSSGSNPMGGAAARRARQQQQHQPTTILALEGGRGNEGGKTMPQLAEASLMSQVPAHLVGGSPSLGSRTPESQCLSLPSPQLVRDLDGGGDKEMPPSAPAFMAADTTEVERFTPPSSSLNPAATTTTGNTGKDNNNEGGPDDRILGHQESDQSDY